MSKGFITENEVPGFLDGPKCVVLFETGKDIVFTSGDGRSIAASLGYVMIGEPRLGLVCDPKKKVLYGHSYAANGLARCVAFEVRKA